LLRSRKSRRKLLEIANSVEAVQDGRIHIEKINGRFLFREHASPANTRPASIWRSSAASSQAGADLFA
jgi:hypothetical protein